MQGEFADRIKDRWPWAARVVFACLLLGTCEDTQDACDRLFQDQIRQPLEGLREYVASLELELERAGLPTMRGIWPKEMER